MSNAQLPIDGRREPLLDTWSFAASERDADRPLGPDAVAPSEPQMSRAAADPPLARNRPELSLLGVGVVVGALMVAVLVLTALAFLFQSSEPPLGAAPAATPIETLRETLSADIKSMQARLAQQQQARQTLTAEVEALRAQVEQILQVPGSTSQLQQRLAALENRLEALSDVELFVGVVEARLEEQETRITFLDDVLSGMRPQGSTREQSASPLPQVELPFHLAAIETWDGRIFASLLHDGHQVLVQPGDECAGWTVRSIDQARRTVRFIRDGVTAVRRAPQ